MKQLDKISEAYYGGMGDSFARKTRERIHWICSKVKGTNVLDIGCSQGITEILLAREGKRVIGIDIEIDSINFAKRALEQENDTVKQNVEYQACSIFEFQSNQLFETVILAEVMEHFASPMVLLDRVSELVAESGTIIITVPFGINDFVDHKKTYYLLNLLEEVEPYFEVSEVKFLGKWLGLVARKIGNSHKKSLFSQELIKQLEDNFYTVERLLIEDSQAKGHQLNKINAQLVEKEKFVKILDQEKEQLKFSNDAFTKQNEQLKDENEQLKKHVEQLEYLTENLKSQYDIISGRYSELEQQFYDYNALKTENSNYKQRIEELEQIIESKNKEILNRLDSEENALRELKRSILECSKLEAKYANIAKKYDLLSKARLGRLTLKYWKFRKRIPQDF